MQTYDAIVLGTGGVGSAALFHLARRGLRVLGLDQFPAAHDRGSSHGDTRIIRQAYFEHPDYVPLLLRAYELWTELEHLTAQQLFYRVGLLQIGPAQGQVISGVLASAEQHRLEVDRLSAQEVESRFAGFRVPEEFVGAFEPSAGFLLVEKCVLAHLNLAQQHGAEHRTGENIIDYKADCGEVIVRTERDEYRAAKLVITAGPWSPQLLSSLRLPLEARRKDVYWFGPSGPNYSVATGCPTYLYELPHGVFYGFPAKDEKGLKAAEHSGGTTIVDPLTIDRSPDNANQDRVTHFLHDYLPGTKKSSVQSSSICFYTMTPDEHFIVDRHPDHSNIVLAAGLSGHGFKFTAVLGEALADLAIEGKTSLPIGLFSITRPALRPVG